MYCPDCGRVIPSEAYYCPYCGKPIRKIYVESLTTPSVLVYLFPDHFLPPLRFMHIMFGERGFKSPTSNVSVNERNISIIMIASTLIWLKENNLIHMYLSEEKTFGGLIRFPAVFVRKASSGNFGDGSLEDIILNRVLVEDTPLSVYSITRRLLDLRGVLGIFGFPSSSSFILKIVENYLIQRGIIKVETSILSKNVKVNRDRILGFDKNLEEFKILLSNFNKTNALLFQRIIENIDRGFYSKLPITWLIVLVFIILIAFLRVRLL